MTSYLFVYGTLMLRFDTPITRFLRRSCSFAGEAKAPGRLYDLGSYPGFVYDEQEQGMVSGQLLFLQQTEMILKILDEYEVVDISNPEAGEYRRERRLVRKAGEWAECWIYLYNGDTSGLYEIRPGNYADYAGSNAAHRQFLAQGSFSGSGYAGFPAFED